MTAPHSFDAAADGLRPFLIAVALAALPFLPGRIPTRISHYNIVAIIVEIVAFGLLLSDHFRGRQHTPSWNLLTQWVLASVTLSFFLLAARFAWHGDSWAGSDRNIILRQVASYVAFPLMGVIAVGGALAVFSAIARCSAVFWVTLALCTVLTWSLFFRVGDLIRLLL